MRTSAESPARVSRGVETFMFVGTAGDYDVALTMVRR